MTTPETITHKASIVAWGGVDNAHKSTAYDTDVDKKHQHTGERAYNVWDTPLNDNGLLKQAEELGAELSKKLQDQGLTVALCAVSPLVRTHQTAAAALGFTNSAHGSVIVSAVEVWSSLSERSNWDMGDSNMMRPHPAANVEIGLPRQLARCGHAEWVYEPMRAKEAPSSSCESLRDDETGSILPKAVGGLVRFQLGITDDNAKIGQDAIDTSGEEKPLDKWADYSTETQLDNNKNVGDLYSAGMSVPSSPPFMLLSHKRSSSERMLADILHAAVHRIKNPAQDVLVLSSHSLTNIEFFDYIQTYKNPKVFLLLLLLLLLLLIARGGGKEPTVCSCKIRIWHSKTTQTDNPQTDFGR